MNARMSKLISPTYGWFSRTWSHIMPGCFSSLGIPAWVKAKLCSHTETETWKLEVKGHVYVSYFVTFNVLSTCSHNKTMHPTMDRATITCMHINTGYINTTQLKLDHMPSAQRH